MLRIISISFPFLLPVHRNMTALIIARLVICGIVLLITTLTDLLNRQIPNILTMPSIALGLLLTAVCKEDVLFVLVVLAILFFVGMLGVFGSGDLKLIMAVTTLCGVMPMLVSVGIASLGILLTELLFRPREAADAIKDGLCILTGKKQPNSQGRKVPFAPCLLCGYIMWITLKMII